MPASLQERAARALPAEHVENAGGWWLRHAPSCAWWVGSVLPHASGGVLRRIAEAERFYADRGAVARFQITPGVCPDGLDAALAERGYQRQITGSLQVAATADVLRPTSLAVCVDDHPTRAWFDTWSAMHPDESAGEWDMLARVKPPSAYAGAMIGDEVVAVGRAVADTGWAGVFSMCTFPSARGKGAARAVLAALATWAGARGADRMYLQMERENLPAMRLYAQMGFHELCNYHYRTLQG